MKWFVYLLGAAVNGTVLALVTDSFWQFLGVAVLVGIGHALMDASEVFE